MRASSYFGIFFVLFVGYLLYTPVPEGITEPFKYRMFAAANRLVRVVIKVCDIIWPDEPNDALVLRKLPKLLAKPLPSEEPGSNFRASDTTFDGVKVRLYEPIRKREKLMPGFIYIHGGGWTIGDTDIYDGLTRQIADGLDAVVVSIDYRLAPEHPFPAPFEDSLKASKWFLTHAKDYGVDPNRVGMGGDSAGGSLTSLVTQHIYDDKSTPNIKVQMLIYPSVQKLDSWLPSYQKTDRDFGNGGFLPRKQVARFISYHLFGKVDREFERAYLANNHTSPEFKKSNVYKEKLSLDVIPTEFQAKTYYSSRTPDTHGDVAVWNRVKSVLLDPRMCTLGRKDFRGLPEAYIMTVGFDPLRDDGIIYAETLKKADVPVSWVHYEEGFHGVFWLGPMFKFELGERARREAISFVKSKLY